MTNEKTKKYYSENVLPDRDYGIDTPEDKIRYLGVRPIGTGDIIELPYRNYWEFSRFKKFVSRIKSGTMLELGCGAGRYAIYLSSFFSSIEAVDMSKVQIDVALQDIKTAGINNVEFTCGDVITYQPKNNRFDVIYFSGVLQYLSDSEVSSLIQRLLPYLNENGIIIERSTVVKDGSAFESSDPNYFSYFRTAEQLEKLFRNEGLIGGDQGATYQYLRWKKLWQIGGLRHIVLFGCKHIPWISFRLMKYISKIYDVIYGSGYPAPSGGYAIHDFFVFRKKSI